MQTFKHQNEALMNELTRSEGVEKDRRGVDGCMSVHVKHACQGHQQQASGYDQELWAHSCSGVCCVMETRVLWIVQGILSLLWLKR